jgi:hypothetical protein
MLRLIRNDPQGVLVVTAVVPKVWQLLNRHPIVSISTPFVIALGYQATRKNPSEWITAFVKAARELVAGGDIYGDGTSYLYPPFMALMSIPFVPLSELAARLGWFGLNIACIVGLVRSAWLLAGGSMLNPITTQNRRNWAVAGLGILCCAPFILNALAHQQVDIIIAFLAVAGCLQLARGQDTVGAVLIGLAAACKGPPLLFAPYLLFRRKWLAAGLVAIVAVGVNILPDLFVSPPDGRARLLVWAERFAVPTFYGQLGAWIGSNGVGISNQALAGTLQRIFTTTLQSTPSGGVMVTGFRQVPEALVKLIFNSAICEVIDRQ